MENKKEVVQKYLEGIKEKFDHFFGCFTKIIDNKIEMHIIVRTKNGFVIPSKEDKDNIYYFLRDIFEKSGQINISYNNTERKLEYWFIFDNLK